MNQCHYGTVDRSPYEEEGEAVGSRDFINHVPNVALVESLNLSGLHFCTCQCKHPLDKEPQAHSSL